jgi:hypothetical protein
VPINALALNGGDPPSAVRRLDRTAQATSFSVVLVDRDWITGEFLEERLYVITVHRNPNVGVAPGNRMQVKGAPQIVPHIRDEVRSDVHHCARSRRVARNEAFSIVLPIAEQVQLAIYIDESNPARMKGRTS